MAFRLGRRMVRCPYCFARVALAECDVVSAQAGGAVLRAGLRGWGRLRAYFWLPSLQGERTVRELATWRCMRCGERLPANSDVADTVVIGLIGGGAAGKTHYLTALIERLGHGADLRGAGCRQITPVSQEVIDRYRENYHDVVFRERAQLPVTAPIQPGPDINRPLIYTLLLDRRGWRRRGRQVNLVLFDGSGEQLVRQQELVQFHRYVLNADGLILLVDPHSLPAIERNLPPFLRDDTVDAEAPVRLLQSVLGLQRKQHGLPPDRPIDVPLAVALAKADLLRHIPRTIMVPRDLLADSGYVNGYDEAEARGVSQVAEEVVRRLGAQELLALAPGFRRRSFHLISATGGPATAADHHFPNVTPTRCLDPFFWLLYTLGVLDGRRAAQAGKGR